MERLSRGPPNTSSSSENRAPVVIETGYTYQLASRCLDLIISIPLLIILTPLTLIIAVAVRLDSPGPALFRHKRVKKNRRIFRISSDRREGNSEPPSLSANDGCERRSSETSNNRRHEDRFGQEFNLYKFRTMYVDARERFPNLYVYQFTEEELNTVPIKVLVGTERGPDGFDKNLGDDPRLTRVGRWLRRTSLDELPNLINVITGDMSLIGPRPDIAENVRHYRPEHMAKIDVKPGVTGLAQVSGRGSLSFHQTNEYDIEYIKHQSFWGNIKILFKTIWIALKGRGAY